MALGPETCCSFCECYITWQRPMLQLVVLQLQLSQMGGVGFQSWDQRSTADLWQNAAPQTEDRINHVDKIPFVIQSNVFRFYCVAQHYFVWINELFIVIVMLWNLLWCHLYECVCVSLYINVSSCKILCSEGYMKWHYSWKCVNFLYFLVCRCVSHVTTKNSDK